MEKAMEKRRQRTELQFLALIKMFLAEALTRDWTTCKYNKSKVVEASNKLSSFIFRHFHSFMVTPLCGGGWGGGGGGGGRRVVVARFGSTRFRYVIVRGNHRGIKFGKNVLWISGSKPLFFATLHSFPHQLSRLVALTDDEWRKEPAGCIFCACCSSTVR